MRIQVHGEQRVGSRLCIVASEDARIWMSQMVQIEGVNAVNPVTGADTGMLRWTIINDNVDLKAGIPVEVEITPMFVSGKYRNVTALPKPGAILYGGGDAWPGDVPEWIQRVEAAEKEALLSAMPTEGGIA